MRPSSLSKSPRSSASENRFRMKRVLPASSSISSTPVHHSAPCATDCRAAASATA